MKSEVYVSQICGFKTKKLNPLLADYSDLQHAYFLNINVLCIPFEGHLYSQVMCMYND